MTGKQDEEEVFSKLKYLLKLSKIQVSRYHVRKLAIFFCRAVANLDRGGLHARIPWTRCLFNLTQLSIKRNIVSMLLGFFFLFSSSYYFLAM